MRYSVGECWKVGLAALLTVGGVAYIVLASAFPGGVGHYEGAIGRVLERFIPRWLWVWPWLALWLELATASGEPGPVIALREPTKTSHPRVTRRH